MRRRVRIALEDDGGSKPAKLAECVGERTGEIVPEEEQSSPMGEEGSGSAVEGGGEELKPAGCIARDSHGRGRRAASASARSWGARSAVAGGKSLGAICRTAASASVRTLAAGDRRKVAITGMAGRGAHKGPQAQKGPQTKSEPLGLGGMSHISNISLWIPVSVRDGRIWEKARKVLWPIIFGPGRSSHDLLEEAKHRAAVVLFLIVVLAYLMSLTSESVLVNIPIAALMLAGMRRLYLEVDFNWRWRPSLMNRGQESVQGFQSASPVWQPLVTPASASTPSEHSFLHHSPSMPPRSETVGVDGVWRQAINAPAVEAAIDDLMRAVLDEFVTNLWYRSFTPDQDATEELRLLLNTAIGEIAKRVKKVNLISLLARDAVELLGKQLDLFRRTRERIGEQLLETLPSGERDEQIRQAMDAAGDLHVSLTSVDAEYKVLRRLMGGVVAIILRPEEAHCGVLRCLARELLACALMKPVMKFASPGYINEVILLLVPSLEERSERHRRACASTPESSAQDKKLRGSPKQTIVIPVQPSDEAPVRTPTPRAAAEAASVPTPGLRPVPTPVPFPPVLASSSLDAQSESMSSSASVGSSGKDRRCSSRNKSRPGSGSGVYDGYKGPAELDGRKIVVCYQENGVVEGAVLSLPHQGKTAMSKRSVSPPMRDTGEMEQARKDQVNKGHLGGVKLDKEETRCKYVDGRSKALVTEHWDGLWTGVDGKGRRQQSALVKGEEKENGGVKTAMAESKSGQERKSEAEGRKRPKRDTVQREKEVVAGPERPASDVFAKVQKGAIMAKERPGSDQSVNASVKSDVEKDESMELLSLKGRRQNEGVNMGEEEDGERYFGSFRQQQRENKFRRLFDDDRVEEIRGIGFLGMEDKGIVWRVGQSCQSTLVARSDPNRSSCSGQRGGMGKAATLEMAQDTENFSGSQQRPSTIHEVKGSSSASQHHQSVSCLPGIEMKLSEEDEMDAVDLDEVDSVSTLRRHGKVNLDRPIPTAQEKKEEIEEVHLKGNRWEDQPVVGRMNEHQRSSSVNLRVAGDRLTLLRRSASDMGCSSSTFDATIKLQAKVVDTWLQEAGLKSFVVYTIFVTHVDGSDWIVNRRYRNFEQLHGVLKEMPQYRLKLPPKLFTGPTGDP
ncbi:hypothetical protein CBR_g32698 [Chara braunii]|uniref:PX domain-containing protein n=1 Tax=Chara braunii TaxID=69332 RepID=A0A388LHA0_CHABU|nr:hypothetical protein CBR_g32698 [Chara braunii]|eukprot:GBG81704.1 hypothetical protein CBR_g32698 [Chara braunii]